ncbi:kinase-like protein [Flagelloscypha sp. PMI_526]|nr:kinase-like protein [Flagelloscypha sp. PMI_526]
MLPFQPMVVIITGATTHIHHHLAVIVATPGTENVDKQAVGGVEATTGTDRGRTLWSRSRDKRDQITKSISSSSKASSLKQDIEEREISNDASPSTSASTPAPAPAPTLCLMNPSQPSFAVLRPPSPALPPPPRDPEPELELVIEPPSTVLSKEPLNLQLHSLHRASFHECPTPVGDGNGDGETTAAEDFELSKAESPKLNADGFGAADYDESADRREDAERALLHRTQNAMDVDEEEFEEVEEVVDDEDVDDMFAFDDDEKPKKKAVKKVKKSRPANILPDGGVGLDATDDPEGYYTPNLGETLDGKYHVFSIIGIGIFAVVVIARLAVADDDTLLPDAAPKREVAIKIMRSQETMYKSGQREAALLAKLNAADPDDKRHVVRLERTVGLEILKRFGKDVGLSIAAVKAYAIQIFLALSLFKKESITHADIKPDNILISNNTTTLKVCDLGSAADASSAESTPTPYLVSRFYRAPEIILGLPHDSSLDTWSVGCTLFELYTGRILFPGQTNRHMLQLHMECKGRSNSKLIKKANGGDGAEVFSSKAERDVKTRLLGGSGGEAKEVRDLMDLIEKCLVLDSGRRITPNEALGHPFLKR